VQKKKTVIHVHVPSPLLRRLIPIIKFIRYLTIILLSLLFIIISNYLSCARTPATLGRREVRDSY